MPVVTLLSWAKQMPHNQFKILLLRKSTINKDLVVRLVVHHVRCPPVFLTPDPQSLLNSLQLSHNLFLVLRLADQADHVLGGNNGQGSGSPVEGLRSVIVQQQLHIVDLSSDRSIAVRSLVMLCKRTN
jgi:hypothetical protein